jgi:hypothetical protein
VKFQEETKNDGGNDAEGAPKMKYIKKAQPKTQEVSARSSI